MIALVEQPYTCQYCNHKFTKEKTLAVHICEQKRRALSKNEKHVLLGYETYNQFYKLTQKFDGNKTYDEFAKSPYYNAFVKFGSFISNVAPLYPNQFIKYVVTSGVKLDHWCKDSLYEEWLHDYVKRENVQDALERGIREMQAYAEDHPELKNGYVDYFRYGNHNRICFHITTGRLSPWVLYNCDSGVDFLSSIDGHAVELIMPWIDPDYWQKKFADYMADTEWAKHMLSQAGL